jgi:hypothetical protein
MTLPSREKIVTRIYHKCMRDAAFHRFFRGHTQSQIFLVINVILRARREVAAEVRAEETPPADAVTVYNPKPFPPENESKLPPVGSTTGRVLEP